MVSAWTKESAFSGVVVVAVVVNSDPWFVSDLVKKMQEVEGLCKTMVEMAKEMPVTIRAI